MKIFFLKSGWVLSKKNNTKIIFAGTLFLFCTLNAANDEKPIIHKFLSIYTEYSNSPLSITPLSSFTNDNFLINTKDSKFVMRIPGLGTECFVDRESEHRNALVAYLYGFNPTKILFFENETGFQITSFVESTTPLKWEDFYHTDTITEVVTLLSKIHHSSMEFNNIIDTFHRIDQISEYLINNGVEIPENFNDVSNNIQQVRTLLSSPKITRVTCHNDPVPSNFVKTSSGLCLFDWEHSGLNDPAWDLAIFSCVMDFNQKQEDELYKKYDTTDAIIFFRMILYKPVVEYWLALWALSKIDEQRTPLAKDFFYRFSSARLKKCKRYFNASNFKQSFKLTKDFVQD